MMSPVPPLLSKRYARLAHRLEAQPTVSIYAAVDGPLGERLGTSDPTSYLFVSVMATLVAGPLAGEITMRSLLMALAAGALCVSTGCASTDEKPAAQPQAVTAAPAPVAYPTPCPKLRRCLDAHKAMTPTVAAELEELWRGVEAEYAKSPQQASQRCAMSLRGYAKRASAPPSCK